MALTDYKNKNSLRADDLRRRREEQQVEIRRQKREENIAKRRNLAVDDGADSDEEGSTAVCSEIFLSILPLCNHAIPPSVATLRRSRVSLRPLPQGLVFHG